MAGYWNLSRIQQQDLNGKPLVGALAYFYQSGTTSPMPTYRAAALGTSNLHSQPVEADGNGRFPAVFFDDSVFSFYRVRVTDAAGSLIFDDDTVPIIGQAVEGGGEPPASIDQTALFATGSLRHFYGTGSKDGWVRANGRSIGSSTSGASERANADTQPLFEHLWAADANLSVSGGRGASAAADWSANKRIDLPDLRGRTLFGLDDMGNSAATRIAAGWVDSPYSPTTLGGKGGEDDIALTLAQLAAHDHGGASGAGGSHTHFIAANANADAALSAANNVAFQADQGTQFSYTLLGKSQTPTLGLTSQHSNHTHTIPSAGSGSAHENMPPFALVTIYIKL